MRNISASQVKLYRQCRQQYYDKYVNRPDDYVETQDTSGLLGTGIHKAIEMYYSGGKSPQGVFTTTIRESLAKWQDTGVPVNYRYSYAEIIDQGLSILNTFDFSKFSPKYNEMSFDLPFYDLCKVRGFMDLITEDDVIVDFKSAKRKPKDLNKDPQFILYAWAYFQMFGKWPKSVLWYHLRTHETFEFKFDWNTFDSVVLDTVKEMINDDFSDLSGERCSNCAPWCYRYGLRS